MSSNENTALREIPAYARTLEDKLREIRRDLHRHPELAFQEVRTAKRIREELAKLPDVTIRLELPGLPTATIAELPGTRPGSGTIGLRCDIDALQIHEENTHDFVSLTPGVMHGCGHDGHVAVLLGAAMILQKFRPEKNVRFLFQPAEECIPDGAPPFLAGGAIDGLEEVYGFHLNATSDFGNVGFYDGAVMSGGTAATVTVRGKSGHPAYPEKCINPVNILSRIVLELETTRAKMHGTAPWQMAVLSFHSVEKSSHATPETAELLLRSAFLQQSCDAFFRELLPRTAQGIASLYGASAHVEFRDLLPLTFNTAKLGEKVRRNAELFGYPLEQIVPSMGGDDFGYYARRIPAYYMTFGLRKGENFPIAHTPHFNFDESILPTGAAMMASCAY